MKIEIDFDLIDGNVSDHVVGYCNHYKGFITYNQSVVHNCINKNCSRFLTIEKCFNIINKKFDNSIFIKKIKSFKNIES